MVDNNHPAAEIILGCPGHYLAWFLLMSGLAIFCLSILKRARLIRMGRYDPRFAHTGRRLFDLVRDGVLQRRQPRYLVAGVLHIIIFWGFVVLGLHSIDLVIGGLRPGIPLPFMGGAFAAFYSSLKDLFVPIVLAAVVIAGFRRAVTRPERYRDSHRFEAHLVLFLIAFLMVTDLLYEGSRLIVEASPSGVLPVAHMAKAILSDTGPEAVVTIYHLSYWLHLLGFYFFLNLLPLSKHFHIITALPNVFLKSLNGGAIKPPRWDAPGVDLVEQIGVRTVSDFTWKHILDLYTCTECGRCTDNCPAYTVGRPLSPKKLTMDLRDTAYRHSSLFATSDLDGITVPGGVIPDETFWSCTTCGACEQECPVFIEHIDKIVELRRHRVSMESSFPPEIEQAYRNMESYGDSWGRGPALRTDWSRGLQVDTVQSNPDIDILYWVGCAGAFDSRGRQVAAAFVNILRSAGVSFGILGPEENCCGDYARRTGNEYLFQVLAGRNIETLQKYGIDEIVTTCPHGYNTLRNEYPQLGGEFTVVHSSEFILNLMESGKLTPSRPLEETVGYHDPCYLGRHNGIYEAPRRILASVPGITLAEPQKTGDASFCCGAGGGHYWMVSSGQRMNDVRTEQLVETSAGLIATGCPYCLIMLEDGIESKEMKGQVLVRDIIEVVSDSIREK